jgi:TonB family protein
MDESKIRKAIAKVPGLSLLQRHRFKAGEDFMPARPVKEVTPTVPITLRKALGNDEVNVDVKVEIDSNGQVKKLDAPESSRHADFVKLAADTAKRWKFEPARLRGKQVSSSAMLHFKFAPGNR